MKRKLTRKEIRRLVRRIEAEEGFRLGVTPKVTFTNRKRHPYDFGSWKGSSHPTRPGFRRLNIRVFSGVAPDLQALVLEHELRESLRRLKGHSPTRAHEGAMRAERKTLRRLPYRTKEGEPYERSGSLLRRQDPTATPARRPPASPLWGTLKRWLGW